MIIYLNGSFHPKGCHKVGTDALVCPLQYSTLHYKQLPLCGQTRASVPTLWCYPQSKIPILTNSREALLPLGEAGRGFQKGESVPTL